MTEDILEKHRLEGTALMQPAIFGFNDGLVSILALVAGMTGGVTSTSIILLAGIVGAVGGAISLGLGGYISAKSEREIYEKAIRREEKEMKEVPEEERAEVREIYRRKGFEGDLLDDIVDHITSDRDLWLDTMLKNELGFVKENLSDPVRSGLVTFMFFLAGAAIPLAPYLFLPSLPALYLATALSAVGLFTIGVGKTKFTAKNWLRSGVEHMTVGMVAAGGAFYIGSLIPVPADVQV